LALMAALLPLAFPGCGKKDTPPIKIGILHSLTGTMAISETSLKDAEVLAIEEINLAGGLLGRELDVVVEDPQSRFADVFPEKARKLLEEDEVAVVFGCWTSASRKSVLPVFEGHNGLLFYPVQYEGNESSRNVVYAGAAPNQQILPAVDWLLQKGYKKFYLLGSDYVFPRTANYIITEHLKAKGLAPVAVRYAGLGSRDYRDVVRDIRKAAPDAVFSTINGDSNVFFYRELAAQKITPEKVPVVAVSVGEDELRRLDPSAVKGHMAAWNYFQSVDTPRNQEFVKKFKDRYGGHRVTDDPIAAAYSQVYLWKMAVEKAGTTDVERVRLALRDLEFNSPAGRIKVDPKTQHTYKIFRMGRIRADRQFDIVYESPAWIAPEPYPQVAFPGWGCDWTGGGITAGKEVQIMPP
jgi:urea transport system substrate-binding protein